MPFKALVNGRLRAAWEYDDAEWEALREEVRAGTSNIFLPCCREAGYPGRGFQRTSPRGTRHFYHAPDPLNPCVSKGESAEHLELKWQILQACRDLGCRDTDLEVDYKTFRADVSCKSLTIPYKTIAFEIQLSSITYEELVRRNNLYAANGIFCVWLLKKFPPVTSRQSILNRVVQGPGGEAYPPFKDPKYQMYAEDRIVGVLIDPVTGDVGYPKNDSRRPLRSFVADVVTSPPIEVDFKTVIDLRHKGLVDFLYRHRAAALLETSVYAEVGSRIDLLKKRSIEDLLAEKTRDLELRKKIARDRIAEESRRELEVYEARLRETLYTKEREKLAMKFILKAHFDLPVYGDPIDAYEGVGGKTIKYYDRRMFD